MEFDFLKDLFSNFDGDVIRQVIKEKSTFEEVYCHLREFNEFLQEE